MSFKMLMETFGDNKGTPVLLLSMAGIKIQDLHMATLIQKHTTQYSRTRCDLCGSMTAETDDGMLYHVMDNSPVCKPLVTLRNCIANAGERYYSIWRRMDHDTSLKDAHMSRVLFGIGTKTYLFARILDKNVDFSYNFLVEFRHPISTIPDALREMMPKEARIARAEGMEVQRQGDIYFIETDLETGDIPGKIKKGVKIYGTNHVATESKSVDHIMYVRKSIKHRHHVRPNRVLSLGDHAWWKAVISPVKSWRT